MIFVSFFCVSFLMQDMMVGDEARRHCRKQKMNYPVDNIGIVRSWEDMKHLWDYAFGETKLNVDPKACKVSYKRKILSKLYNIHDTQVRILNSRSNFQETWLFLLHPREESAIY